MFLQSFEARECTMNHSKKDNNDHQLVTLTLGWLRNRSEFSDSLTSPETILWV